MAENIDLAVIELYFIKILSNKHLLPYHKEFFQKMKFTNMKTKTYIGHWNVKNWQKNISGNLLILKISIYTWLMLIPSINVFRILQQLMCKNAIKEMAR